MGSVQKALRKVALEYGGAKVLGAGVTGSGRQLIGAILGADVVKNEITAHGVAALRAYPGVRTVFEIGGQDSKIILINQGVAVDFGMNTVCAAGTGSFLDQQAHRLNLSIFRIWGDCFTFQTPGSHCRTLFGFCRIRYDS